MFKQPHYCFCRSYYYYYYYYYYNFPETTPGWYSKGLAKKTSLRYWWCDISTCWMPSCFQTKREPKMSLAVVVAYI